MTTNESSKLLHTNPLLCNELPTYQVECVVALLGVFNFKDHEITDEAYSGWQIVLEWIKRSLNYINQKDPPNSIEKIRYTNPLISDDFYLDNARAVLALLTFIDVDHHDMCSEGNQGLNMMHEWLKRSSVYSDQPPEHAIAG